MSACRITRMSRGVYRGILAAMAQAVHAAMSPAAAGPAAGVSWNLADLYAGPDAARAAAERFAARWRGRIAETDAAGLAAAVDELERIQEPVARAGSFAGLLFAGDT